jgi:hypothetical protein
MNTLHATMLVVGAAMAMGTGNFPSSRAEEASPAAQFDFWLGNWELTSGGKPAGTNTITREYDGAVIMERFAGSGENALHGMSVSVFNKNTGRWNQTWVDNQGGYLDFEGGFADGKMILSRHATIQGKEVAQRMVWFNITPDSFDWNWERSDDNGATWKTLWPIHYERKAQ